MRRIALFSLISSVALFFAACGPAITPTPAAEITVPPTTQVREWTWPRTVTDALGREVTFDSAPTRIVVAGNASTLIADALYLFPEAKTNIAGISIRGQGADFLPILDENINEKLALSGDAGAEQIATLHPDLVILKSYLSSSLGAAVDALDIPVFYVYLEAADSYAEEVTSLGQIFDDPSRAQLVTEYYLQHIDDVNQVVSSLSDNQKPSVLIMQHSAKGGTVAFKVPPVSWLQTDLVKIAGGDPAWLDIQLASDSWNVITLEQVAAWNPDQIYIIDYFDDPSVAVEELKNDPITADLKAVQNNQVFGFPKDTVSWDQPDTRWILGLNWLASHIHPELFSTFDFNQEYLTFYQDLYGLDEARVNSDLKPLLQGSIP